jgi:g-D-glutamyl-meso-diaminopimelate peptidase
MYTFEMLYKDSMRIKGAEVFTIGYSVKKRPIIGFHTGSKKGKQIIICAAMHAREHITSFLTVKLISHCVKNKFGGGIYFIPMVNPDGVSLCRYGVNTVKCEKEQKRLIELNGGSEDFSLWKANIRGVDLNVNFDANYGSGVSNVNVAGSENYIGEHVFSEPETQAVAQFTLKVNPAAVISYHCKGEVIYWRFYQEDNLQRDFRLAKLLSDITGYELVDESGSAGGYKDWCIQKLKVPSFTIEVGSDEFCHPFPYSQIGGIFQKNKDVPVKLHNNL